MANKIPLRIVYVNGTPQIGEFQSGDTLGVIHGGLGTSSLGQFKDDLGLLDLTLSSSLVDINPSIRAGLLTPNVGDSLVWSGNFWTASSVAGGDTFETNNLVQDNGTNVNGLAAMPYPAPFYYLEASADGTTSGTVQFGAGTGVFTYGLDSKFSWNDTTDELTVSDAGVYRIKLSQSTSTDTIGEHTINLYVNSTLEKSFILKIHTVAQPVELVIDWVGKIGTGENMYIQSVASAGTLSPKADSSIYIERLA